MTIPGFSTGTLPAINPVFANDTPPVAEKITLALGQNLSRGAVLGRITGGATATDDNGVADPGNTGDGTIGTQSAGAGA